jgi:gamma-glutamylcyclotransferase (GGCT)/AIG2-like uncharacterized protein YtfP
MEKLFGYGTLLDLDVQQRIIGRPLKTHPVILDGYRRERIEIDGEAYPRITPDSSSIVQGAVMEVTRAELEFIDGYEGADFERVRVTLRDGTEAWAYIDPGN